MPKIPVNLADVEAYTNLPVGEYFGEVAEIVWKAAKEAGKFPQLMAKYTVLDEGDQLGQTSTEFISLSPKAAFRLKAYMDKFGVGDIEDLDVDDETDILMDPDLAGRQVIFKVFKERDKRVADATAPDAYRIRTELVSVEDDENLVAKPKTASTPEPEAEDAEAEETEAEEPAKPRAVARPPRPAPTVAQPARRTLR